MQRTQRLIGALLSLALVAGCAGVRASGHPDFALRPGETFAWIEAPSRTSSAQDPTLPWDDFRASIVEQLEERGLTPADSDDADVFVDVGLSVEVVTQQNDPNFELYVAERYERGTLTLELTRAHDPNITWTASRRQRLRYVAHTMGGLTAAKWTPIDQERRWELTDAVESMFGKL